MIDVLRGSAAKAWDEANNIEDLRQNAALGRITPKNRPCDRCGKPVERGYIHQECAKQEQSEWLDILY